MKNLKHQSFDIKSGRNGEDNAKISENLGKIDWDSYKPKVLTKQDIQNRGGSNAN